MNLDPDTCYRAILAKDARFDGRFFTGVLTTGIYCRPVCPVRPPKRQNVRFFACSAAAEDGGFRPCKRCRPERSAGLPGWPAGSEMVSRALHLIDDGALDDGNVEGLAARLAVGSRHLRRIFDTHLGAGPLAIARNRRVHFARQLLDETSLPVSQVAFAAGFKSIRQFNLDVRRTFGDAPTQLRRSNHEYSSSPLVIRSSFRPPLDWEALTTFLGARATGGVETTDGPRYRRTITIAGTPGVLEVAQDSETSLLLRLDIPDHRHLLRVVERVRRLFDLGADPASISARIQPCAPVCGRAPAFGSPARGTPSRWRCARCSDNRSASRQQQHSQPASRMRSALPWRSLALASHTSPRRPRTSPTRTSPRSARRVHKPVPSERWRAG